MKYLACLGVCLFLLSCLSSPSDIDKWRAPSGRIKVLSTTPIIDDLVGRIGGERIDHVALMDHAMDPHSYELVKGDDEKFSVAHVIFYNGLGLEHTASLKSQLTAHPHAIALGEEIRSREPLKILQNQGVIDPHIWLDISLWLNAIDPIVSHLTRMDPQGHDFYVSKGVKIKQELSELDRWMREKLQSVASEKRYLVTSHDAFNYFTRRYLSHDGEREYAWRSRFCAPEGLAPDGQLGFHDLKRVIDHLQKNHIKIIFSEANVSRESLHKIVDICREKGMSIHIGSQPLFSDTLADSKTQPLSYEEMMRQNTLALYEAWNLHDP